MHRLSPICPQIIILLFISISTAVNGQSKNQKIIKIDSLNKAVSKIKLKSRGTGEGYAGNSPSWTKERRLVYDFEGRLKRKSLLIKKYRNCTSIPIKVKVIDYENGKWVNKKIKGRLNKHIKIKERS